jgi:predicted cytidylate kinase
MQTLFYDSYIINVYHLKDNQMIISIGGHMGSGKSTLAKQLADALGWPRYYMGGLRREAAAKRGLTLAEYNKLGESDPITDLEVDEYQKKLGETEDNFIIEGRTSWYFIPHSLKLYVDVSDEVGAERIFLAGRKGEDKSMNTYDDVLASIKERKTSDRKRYLEFFSIDTYDLKNYDYVIDTTKMTISEVFNEAYAIIREKLAEDLAIDKPGI